MTYCLLNQNPCCGIKYNLVNISSIIVFQITLKELIKN